MIRSHDSLPWHCCGTQWPKEYRYCGWCGRGVITVDRVLVGLPIVPSGYLAVVASADVDAETWAFLAKTVALTADAFESRAAKKAAAAALAATDTPSAPPPLPGRSRVPPLPLPEEPPVSAPTMFADEFVLAESTHTRCEKPAGTLDPRKHFGITLPGALGRATVDLYADWSEPALYSRVVSMKTGEVAWYRVSARQTETPT